MVVEETGQTLQLTFLTNDRVSDLLSNCGETISSTVGSGNLRWKGNILFWKKWGFLNEPCVVWVMFCSYCAPKHPGLDSVPVMQPTARDTASPQSFCFVVWREMAPMVLKLLPCMLTFMCWCQTEPELPFRLGWGCVCNRCTVLYSVYCFKIWGQKRQGQL